MLSSIIITIICTICYHRGVTTFSSSSCPWSFGNILWLLRYTTLFRI